MSNSILSVIQNGVQAVNGLTSKVTALQSAVDSIKLIPPGYVTPEMFGAVGDGVADDTEAVQDAFDASKQVFLPQVYHITSPVTKTGGENCIRGFGRAHSGLRISSNTQIIVFDVNGGDGYFNSISDLFFVGDGSFGGSQAAIKVQGTNLHQFSFCNIRNLLFYQMHDCILFDNSAVGNSFVNWGQFENLSGFDVDYLIRYAQGTGTGNIYNDLTCVLSGNANAACMQFGNTTDAVGDMMISNCEWGGVGDGIVIDGGSYGSGIAISNTDNDAGINNAVNLVRCSNIQITNQVLGGAAFWTIDNNTCAEIYMTIVAKLSPPQITGNQNDYNPTGLPRAGVLALNTDAAGYNITGLAGGFDARKIRIFNAGANNFTITANDAASAVNNRFRIVALTVLAPQQSINLVYSTANQGWLRDGGQ